MNTHSQTFPDRNDSLLPNTHARGRITVSKGWVICPVCGRQRVLHVLPTTAVKDLPVFCKRCRVESVVNIPTKVPEP